MTKRNYQSMMCAAFVALVVNMTGCKNMCCHQSAGVCRENLDAGLATIMCQPMDVEVTNKGDVAEFEVQACGRQLTYQWYFNDDPIPTDGEGARDYKGVNESKLTVLNVNRRTIGFYRCDIESVDSLGIPLRAATRSASLGTSYRTRMAIISPTQRLPKPGTPAPSPCGGKYCASLSFRNGTTGYIPPVTNPPPNQCILKVSLDGTTLSQNAYDILVYDGAKKFCADDGADDTKVFTIGPGNHAYRFTIYFKCASCPKNTPLVDLTIDWQ